MSSAAPAELSAGRLFILFLAALRVDPLAPYGWNSHRDGQEWDDAVDGALKGAVASQAARDTRAGRQTPAVTWRHVKGGVADATAAASQLLSKPGFRVLVAYVGGDGQAASVAELGEALSGAVTGDNKLVVFVADSKANLGHHHQWEKVFSAFTLLGPEAEAEEERAPHPVLDKLAPQLPAMPVGA